MKFILLSISLTIFLSCSAQKSTTENNATEVTQMSQTNDKTAASILGNWQISMQTPRGNRSTVLNISEQNGQLTGRTDKGVFDIAQNGNTLTWTSEIQSPMGKRDAEHQVKIEGDKMTGSVKMMGRSIPLMGVRK